MENISRGPTFGDFVPIRTEASAGRYSCMTTEYKSTDSPLPPLLNVMYRTAWESLCGQSKYSLRNTKEKGVVGHLCRSLVVANMTIRELHTKYWYISILNGSNVCAIQCFVCIFYHQLFKLKILFCKSIKLNWINSIVKLIEEEDFGRRRHTLFSLIAS
jgi:hypothetical protein